MSVGQRGGGGIDGDGGLAVAATASAAAVGAGAAVGTVGNDTCLLTRWYFSSNVTADFIFQNYFYTPCSTCFFWTNLDHTAIEM